jgi:hypothetical protein
MAKSMSSKQIVVILLILAAVYFMTKQVGPSVKKQQEYYTPKGMNVDDAEDDVYAPANLAGTDINLGASCSMNSGVGLSSSLLPREMASQEDYGQFAPDDILKGQNFLDPRSQIGWPETIGGSLRNANQQLRADPPNPKQGYVWNNSTIVPDIMQRDFCNV